MRWEVGQIVADLYEVRELLGCGGMGEVWRVYHRTWGTELAAKVPTSDALSRQGIEPFVQEAETWVNLGLHPHVASCYYVRDLDHIPVVFAELVDAGTVRRWIRRGQLYEGSAEEALGRILDVSIQIAWGLGHAHRSGLVHQDVKPANVLLTDSAMAKVTDFGLAGAIPLSRQGSGPIEVTGHGMTPAYASPEQLRAVSACSEAGTAARRLSRATDVWSWAVSVVEMFVGEVTWATSLAVPQVLEELVRSSPHSSNAPAVPRGVAAILRQCLALDAEQRPHDLATVVDALIAEYRECQCTSYPRRCPGEVDLLADTLNNRGVSLVDLGRTLEAEEAFAGALLTDPAHLEATYNLGLLRWRRGEIADDQLLRALRNSAEGAEGESRAAQLIAAIHRERGDLEAARTAESSISGGGWSESMTEAASPSAIGGTTRVASATHRSERPISSTEAARAVQPSNRSSESHGLEKLWEAKVPATNLCMSADGALMAGFSRLLDESSPEGGDPRYELGVWRLPECVRVKTLVRALTAPVAPISFTPDGRYLVSHVGVWDVATGRQLCSGVTFGEGFRETELDELLGVSVLDNGVAVSVGAKARCVVQWDWRTGRASRLWESRIERVSPAVSATGLVAVVVEPPNEGRARAGGYDLVLWSLETGDEVAHLPIDGVFEVRSLAFSPDGRSLFVGTSEAEPALEGHIQHWDVQTRTRVGLLEGHAAYVSEVAASPDGRRLYSGDYTTLRVWDLEKQRCVFTVEPKPLHLGIAAEGGVDRLTWVRGSNVERWRFPRRHPRAGLALRQIRETDNIVRDQEAFAAAVEGARVALTRGRVSESIRWFRRARDLPGRARDRDVLELWSELRPHARLAAPRSGWIVRELTHSRGVGLSPDGRVVAWIAAGEIQVWNRETGDLRTAEAPISTTPQGSVRRPHFESVLVGAQGQLVTIEHGRPVIWDSVSGPRHALAPVCHRGVSKTAMSSDGAVVGVAYYTRDEREAPRFQAWALASGECLLQLGREDIRQVKAFALSDGGDRLVVVEREDAAAYNLQYWDVRRKRLLDQWSLPLRLCQAVALVDSQRAVTASMSGLDVWDLPRRRRLASIGDVDGVEAIVGIAGSHCVATGHRDGQICLWNLDEGRRLLRLNSPPTPLFEGLVADAQGRHFVSSTMADHPDFLWIVDWDLEPPVTRLERMSRWLSTRLTRKH